MGGLEKIEDYYILQFDVRTALKVSDHILDAIERLEQFPDSGSVTPDNWLNEQGYRMLALVWFMAEELRMDVFVGADV